jgi:two-component system OmpR family response regulator
VKLLLVEDDKRTASFVEKGLKQAGFIVARAADGEEGLSFATSDSFDVIIADLMMPRMDGLSMIAALRKRKIMVPVIILSAKGSVDDRIRGLQVGSDDYLPKPFSFSELLARVQALMRRTAHAAEPTSLQADGLQMDLLTRDVQRDGQRLELQPLEFSLLEYLLRNAGRVVSKTMIMEHVWDYNFDPQTNVVEARMSRLRDKVDRPFSHSLIHTIRGVGYVLKRQP